MRNAPPNSISLMANIPTIPFANLLTELLIVCINFILVDFGLLNIILTHQSQKQTKR
jgi:hypothetical protein